MKKRKIALSIFFEAFVWIILALALCGSVYAETIFSVSAILWGCIAFASCFFSEKILSKEEGQKINSDIKVINNKFFGVDSCVEGHSATRFLSILLYISRFIRISLVLYSGWLIVSAFLLVSLVSDHLEKNKVKA